MKAYWKKDQSQTGLVTRVYIADNGQKRMEVRFPYSIVDAEVLNFELV